MSEKARQAPQEGEDALARLFAATRPRPSPSLRLEHRILATIGSAKPAEAAWFPGGARLAAAALACALLLGVGLGTLLPLADETDAVEIAVLGAISADLVAELP